MSDNFDNEMINNEEVKDESINNAELDKIDDRVILRSFTDELRNSFVLYSLSVIMSRAIPDVRDGFKPVQRRIMYAMDELGLKHTSSYKKSARIVGEVMGKYHPHGDSSIYEALVRMAQDFSMRYRLVDGQGNFGSIDDDPPAAMRYTEARLTTEAEFMLLDLEKDTVNMTDSFDGSLKEPEVLPARLPNLLLNGAYGIAVGMSTSIPPHNLRELVAAIKYQIDNEQCSISDLLKFVKGPDLPTGGIIVDAENLKEVYETGRGKFTIRAKYEIVENKNGQSIIVTEIPFSTSKVAIIEQLVRYAERMRDEKADSGLRDVRDESDRDGMRLIIELKRNANTNKVINELLKHTSLQTTFPVQINVIHKKKPTQMNLKQVLGAFIEHRIDVVTRRTNYELAKAKRRAHIVEGIMKAISGIDTVIEIIRTSDDPILSLQQTIDVTEEQAKAITEIRLIALSKLEMNKLNEELKQLNETIKRCNDTLQNKELMMKVIKEELDEVNNKFGDERKTEIQFGKSGLKASEEFIEDEDVVIVLTKWGYVKQISTSEYKVQGRGGKGVKGLKIGENDHVVDVIFTTRKTNLLFLTTAGKAYQIAAYEIDKTAKETKGNHIANYISMVEDERVKTIVPIALEGDYDRTVMIFTKNGVVKQTSLREFANARRNGIKAIGLREGDVVVDAHIIDNDDQEIVIITKKGMSLRFKTSDVREMGRGAGGVRAMKIRPDDEIVNAVLVNDENRLLILTENGYAKRQPFEDYKTQSRGGIGTKTLNNISKVGCIISAMSVEESEHLLVFTRNGKAIRLYVEDIKVLKKVTQGIIAVRLDANDSAVSVAAVKFNEEDVEKEDVATDEIKGE